MRREQRSAMLFFTWRTPTGCVVVSTATASMTRFTNNPLCITPSTLFFPRDNSARERTFVGRRRNFRHAGIAPFRCGALCKTRQKSALYTSRSVLREHLRGGQEGP